MSVATISREPAVDAPRTDAVLVAALRERDENAYLTLVRRYTPLMTRIARSYVSRTVVAEDVVQDTWVAVLHNIDRFEGRSTFKTWLIRILVNTAFTRRRQESRTVCWATTPADAATWDGAVRAGGRPEPAGPERRALAGEAWSLIGAALEELPDRQRTVVVLRDVEGWTSEEVSEALSVSPGNQRLLLHRGRTRLRGLLAPVLGR